MKTYHTGSSTDGLTFPHFGKVLGELAKAFRVPVDRIRAQEEIGEKQVRRFFDGDSIRPEQTEAITRAVVAIAVPEPFMADVAVEVLRTASDWNALAATINDNSYPTARVEDLVWAPLRLVALELGFRVGAWWAQRELENRPFSLDVEAWLNGPHQWLDVRRQAKGWSLDELARRVGFSRNTVEEWCSGEALPTKQDAVDELGRCLADATEDVPAVLVLRLLVGLRALRDRLIGVIGDDLVNDLVAGFRRTAEIVRERILFIHYGLGDEQPPRGMRDLDELLAWKRKNERNIEALPEDIRSVIRHGVASELGASLCVYIHMHRAQFRQEAAADFEALARRASADRVSSVLRELANVERHGVDGFREIGRLATGRDDDVTRWVAEAMPAYIRGQFRLADFDWTPPEGWSMTVLESPPFFKAMNRLEQA